MINPEQFREESQRIHREAKGRTNRHSDLHSFLLRIECAIYAVGAQMIMRQDLILEELKREEDD